MALQCSYRRLCRLVVIAIAWFSPSVLCSVDEPQFTTIVDILSENVEFSTFLRLVQTNGYIPYLNDLQNCTLLAPINSAFSQEQDERFDIENYLLHNQMLNTEELQTQVTILAEYTKFPFIVNKLLDTVEINGAEVVEPNLLPNFQNATVQGISKLIEPPPRITQVISNLNSRKAGLVKRLSATMADSIEKYTINNTVLLPLDSSFYQNFNEIEINYIVDAFNSLAHSGHEIWKRWNDDRENILKSITANGIIGGSISDTLTSTNLNGQPLVFTGNKSSELFKVNCSASTTASNIPFDNGLVHTFTNLSLLENTLTFTTEKYLHGLNNSDFVKELYFRNLQELVQETGTQKNITIFVPDISNDENVGYSKSSLLYHFVEEQISVEHIFDAADGSAKIFDSAFCTSNKRLGGNCQRLKLRKLTDRVHINDHYKVLNSKPYKIGNTLIYLISNNLKLPSGIIESINPFFQCSTSLNHLRDLKLLHLQPNNQGYSIFLPCFDPWDKEDLTLQYLQKNKTALSQVMRNMIVDGLIYSDTEDGIIETKNHLGENIKINITTPKNQNFKHLDADSIRKPLQLERNMDIFFNQGVIHPISTIAIPQEVTINLKHLLSTVENNDFSKYLELFQDHIPILTSGEPYSLIVPTDTWTEAWQEVYDNKTLVDLLKLHIIPGNSVKNLKACEGQINTTLGYHLLCEKIAPNASVLKLQGGLDKDVRILQNGCTTGNNESCVFLIDRPLSLKWLDHGKSPIKLPGVALGVGILLGLLTISVLMLIFFVCISRTNASNTYWDGEANETRESEENDPLLSPTHQNEPQPKTFSSNYSSNTQRTPVNISSSANP